MTAKTKPVIKSLRIQNLLSFGENGAEVELEPLNVLIGPNGSGKSNFIEVLGLLQSAPTDLAEPIRNSGGISDWLWKGSTDIPTAKIEVLASIPSVPRSIRYQLSFTRLKSQVDITDERIENESPSPGENRPYFYFGYERGRPMLNVKAEHRYLSREEIDPQKSVLSQRKDLDQYPEVTRLGQLFDSFKLYRNWQFGVESDVRDLYGAELRNDFLEEDLSNLALMLNKLHADPRIKPELLRYLSMFYADAIDIVTVVESSLIDIRLEEKNRITTPLSRLSDGTLRWLAMLTILLNPSPPHLVCIEEPELGLHPDIVRPLAKLLVEASQRMQLVVTTHSDALVDELTETPEAVIVCEKESGSTTLKRLKQQELSEWLKEYTLGELWHKGQIGGTRW
jgi:predicted ATPase